ncbi:hypothetical protein GCM10009839_82750 [Catenulispora yoronensis]|uniref:FAD-binding PCMH-type domain-containing protein n=1 Tax=Catenulispora yoronensis TaxID=450799 RepID=A0ABN2VIK6_9ACTN
MGPGAFGPPGGGFAADGGEAGIGGAAPPDDQARPARPARQADGHALPVHAAGGAEFGGTDFGGTDFGGTDFGGAAARPGFELGAFELGDERERRAEPDDPTLDPSASGEFQLAPADVDLPHHAPDAPVPAAGEAFATGLGGSAVSPAPALFGPLSVVEAVQVLAARPDAVIIAGGTVAMPEITSGRRHPGAIVTLHRCAELRGWSPGPGEVLLHAGLTLTEMQRQELRAQVPAVAQAARTVGSPHIRAAATLGGNLMVGPASADLPVVLAALGAEVLVASVGGVRTVSVFDFYDRDGVPQLTPGELIVGARVPVVRGMQGFMKIGVRGGTSRAILSTTLAVDPARRSATCVVGAMAQAALPSGAGRAGLPTLLRADHADRWLADQVDWDAGAIADPAVYETFGRLVAESLVYGDGSGTVGGGGDPYRRKAAEICARRLLLRALPPLGWLDQVRELQRRADFQRAIQRVERAEQAKSQE